MHFLKVLHIFMHAAMQLVHHASKYPQNSGAYAQSLSFTFLKLFILYRKDSLHVTNF